MEHIQIRRAEHTDIDKLREFYAEAYGTNFKYKYPERYKWIFEENPFNKDATLQIFIAIDNKGRIIGHAAASKAKCKIFNHFTDLGWGVDAFNLLEYRGQGIGKKLQRINQDAHTVFASVSMTEINKIIKLKLGAKKGPASYTYVKFTNFEKRFTSLIIGILQFRLNFKRISKDYSVALTKSDIYDDKDTELWNKTKSIYDFAVERDAYYLNWRYKKQPHTTHYCLRAYNRDKILCGILVYRIAEEVNPKSIIITELFGLSEELGVFNALLKEVEKISKESSFLQIQIAVSDKNIKKIILEKGYIPVSENNLIINGPEHLIGGLSQESTAMITFGDQDWDEYPLAKNQSFFEIIQNTYFNNKYFLKKNFILRNIIKMYFFYLKLRFPQRNLSNRQSL
ncbi:MAG: hypothetical protein PHT69_05750 [Bacteroidales bacterium]|nr:hypothetical protein [Bacteroidales bacterium]